MTTLEIVAIAVALAMDAFAVSVAAGVALRQVSGRQTFRLAWHFGLFQALMPVLGWFAGARVNRWVAAWDHWVAFALLARRFAWLKPNLRWLDLGLIHYAPAFAIQDQALQARLDGPHPRCLVG